MALPWIMALKAAEALLSGAASRRAAATSARQMENAGDRLAALEKADEATAQLILQLTEQVQALTRATDSQAAKLRWLIVVTVLSVVVASAALVVAFVR